MFTANAGIVNGDQFVPSHFRHPERQAETRDLRRVVRGARASTSTALPAELDHEGAGDALPFGGDAARVRLPLPQRRRGHPTFAG